MATLSRPKFGSRGVIALLPLLSAVGGCGALTTVRTLFPDQVADGAGNALYIEDLRAIVDDPDLLDAEKADALRELGLENEDVINAVIADGLSGSSDSTDGLPASKGKQ